MIGILSRAGVPGPRHEERLEARNAEPEPA